jgi:hypothetical protein
MLRIPGKVLAGKLSLNEYWIFSKEKNSAPQADSLGTLGNCAVQQRVVHCLILSQK